MKTLYKTVFALFFFLSVASAEQLFAQEEMTRRAPDKSSSSWKEQVSVQPKDLNENLFAKYKKDAESIPGVKVLGYCKNENIVMIEVHRIEFLTSVPNGKITQEWRDHPEQIPYDNYFMYITSNLTIASGISTLMSIKPVFEVMNKCPDYIK